MISNAEYAIQRGCRSKIRFPSRKRAKAKARETGFKMRVYHCEFCDYWHLTSEGHRSEEAQKEARL